MCSRSKYRIKCSRGEYYPKIKITKESAKTGKPKKKPRLCDVVEQSNEQMKELKDYMQSNSVTVEARSREREEDRVFFRQMMGMMSQTMMGMAQMLVQGGGPGYPPTQAYSPRSVQPNYTFTPTMGYGMVSMLHQLHHHLQAQLLVNQCHLKKTTTIASRNF